MLYRYTSLLRALDFVLCSRMLRALGMCALAPITRGAWTVSHAPHKSIRQPNSAAPPASFCSSALRVSCRVFGMTGICSMIYYHIFTADNHSAVSPNYLSRPRCSNTPGLSHAASLSILRRLRMVPFVLLDEPFLRMIFGLKSIFYIFLFFLIKMGFVTEKCVFEKLDWGFLGAYGV